MSEPECIPVRACSGAVLFIDGKAVRICSCPGHWFTSTRTGLRLVTAAPLGAAGGA